MTERPLELDPYSEPMLKETLRLGQNLFVSSRHIGAWLLHSGRVHSKESGSPYASTGSSPALRSPLTDKIEIAVLLDGQLATTLLGKLPNEGSPERAGPSSLNDRLKTVVQGPEKSVRVAQNQYSKSLHTLYMYFKKQ